MGYGIDDQENGCVKQVNEKKMGHTCLIEYWPLTTDARSEPA